MTLSHMVLGLALVLQATAMGFSPTASSTGDVSAPTADSWQEIPPGGVIFDVTDGAWHMVTVRADPNGSMGDVTFKVSRETEGPEGEDTAHAAAALYLYVPGEPHWAAFARLRGSASIRADLATPTESTSEYAPGVGLLPQAYELHKSASLGPAGSGGGVEEVTFLAVSGAGPGTAVHELTLEAGTRATYRVLSGTLVGTLDVTAFTPRDVGATARVRALLPEANAAHAADHAVASACGVTGAFLFPTGWSGSFSRVGYASNGGDQGYAQSIGVNNFYYGRADPLEFASSATDWTFSVHLAADAGVATGLTLLYGGVSLDAIEAGTRDCR